MSEKVIEHPARVLEEIKAELEEGVIKDSSIVDFNEVGGARLKGFVVSLTLNKKFAYTRAVFEYWRKRLGADDYTIYVVRNRLKIRFEEPCSEKVPEP